MLPHHLHRLVFRLLALLFASSISAATLTQGPQIKVSADSATLTWTTDVSTNSKAAAGSTPEALFLTAEGSPGATHSVTLDHLKPGRTYHYAVGSARQWLAKGTFTTTGASTSAPATTNTSKATPPTPAAAASAAAAKKPSLFSQIVGALKGQDSTPAPSPRTSSKGPSPTASTKPTAINSASAPPTQRTWNSIPSLQDHYDRHGPDFSSTSPDDYAAQAWHFLQRAKKEGLPMKQDPADGTIRVWDPRTRSFAAYTEHGRTRTYFRPNNPSYWTRQPGQPITADKLSF
jgi:hypothetical protein